RRRDPNRGRPLPAVATEGSVPFEVPDAPRIHHDLMAGRHHRSDADGDAPRDVLPLLFFGAVCSAVPAWHDEHYRDGLHYGADLCREDTALGANRGPDCCGRAHRLWRLGIGRTARAADIRTEHNGDPQFRWANADALRTTIGKAER